MTPRSLPLLILLPLVMVAESAQAIPPGWLAKPKRAPTITSFTATPSTVVAYGSSTLAWTVTGTAPITLSIDQGVGAVVGASTSVSLVQSSVTYTLTATNAKGSTTATATVTVTGPYLIADDAGTITHVWFNGSALQDTKAACNWTMTGTVPQVAAGASGTTLPAGAGNFSDTAHYKCDPNANGNDPGDILGPFTAVLVFGDTTTGVPLADGTFNADGWFVQRNDATHITAYTNTAGSATATADAIGTLKYHVLCFGRFGAGPYTQITKLDGRTAVTLAAKNTAATTTPMYLGRYTTAGIQFAGKVWEFHLSSTPASDAACAALTTTILARAGAQ